jgi:hypothetical protein
MMTVDQFLKNNIQHVRHSLLNISKKDKHVLVSLCHQINSSQFLTEKQAQLLLTTLNNNIKKLKFLDENLNLILETPQWSKPFRVLEKVKKVYIDPQIPDHFVVDLEYSYNIKVRLNEIVKTFSDVKIVKSKYIIPIKEKYLFQTIDFLVTVDCTIDSCILDLYNSIKSIYAMSSKESLLSLDNNQELKSLLENQQQLLNIDYDLYFHDRSIRHQYYYSSNLRPINLTNQIALRERRSLYADPEKISLTDILVSLNTLKRMPVLFIFEGRDSRHNSQCLTLVKQAVDLVLPTAQVGVFFRFDSQTDTHQFNQLVSEYQFNQRLDEKSTIIGIANHKLIKFIVNSQWKPETIISFTNGFYNNKVYSYFHNVDLVVYYTQVKPISFQTNELM